MLTLRVRGMSRNCCKVSESWWDQGLLCQIYWLESMKWCGHPGFVAPLCLGDFYIYTVLAFQSRRLALLHWKTFQYCDFTLISCCQVPVLFLGNQVFIPVVKPSLISPVLCAGAVGLADGFHESHCHSRVKRGDWGLSCYSFPWGWLVCTGGFAVMVLESGTRTTQAIMKGFSSGKNAGIESEQWWAYLSGSHPAFPLGEVF